MHTRTHMHAVDLRSGGQKQHFPNGLDHCVFSFVVVYPALISISLSMYVCMYVCMFVCMYAHWSHWVKDIVRSY
jgi:hypothetical protein